MTWVPHGLGSGGGGGLHFRHPVDEFTGADLAACRTARDTYFSTTAPQAHLQFVVDRSLAVVLNPANSVDNTFETYVGAAGGTYDATQWLDRTDAIQGNPGTPGTDGVDGVDGAQGRFYLFIHTNNAAQPTPDAPTGGMYDLGTGTFTPPTGTTEDPTSPGAGEDVWISQAEINPAIQSGSVTPVWSEWTERSHLSAGISHVETDASLSGTGVTGDPLGLLAVAVDASLTGAGITSDPLAVASPVTANPTAAFTDRIERVQVGTTVYEVPDDVVDVTDTGLPVLDADNYKQIFIDHDTPRVWVGHRTPHYATDPTGTWAALTHSQYRGARTSDPGSPSISDVYYNTQRHQWREYVAAGMFSPAGWTNSSFRYAVGTLLGYGTVTWLGEQQDDLEALRVLDNFDTSRTTSSTRSPPPRCGCWTTRRSSRAPTRITSTPRSRSARRRASATSPASPRATGSRVADRAATSGWT